MKGTGGVSGLPKVHPGGPIWRAKCTRKGRRPDQSAPGRPLTPTIPSPGDRPSELRPQGDPRATLEVFDLLVGEPADAGAALSPPGRLVRPSDDGRAIHGYRISQLFSSKVDPGEILEEYRTTRFPERFYNLKIGTPWADLERRLDLMSVLSLCTDTLMLEKSDEPCIMGVDTGKLLHVVILKPDKDDDKKNHLVHLAVCHNFTELDGVMARFKIEQCVIDGLPETHATREFTQRHAGTVFMNFFNENQRGAARFDHHAHTVQVHRTEALDASRAAIREKRVVLPRRLPIVETFARHMVVDAKILDEDQETGAKKYRYIRTPTAAPDHFSLAFTYAWIAASDQTGARAWIAYMRRELNRMKKARGER